MGVQDVLLGTYLLAPAPLVYFFQTLGRGSQMENLVDLAVQMALAQVRGAPFVSLPSLALFHLFSFLPRRSTSSSFDSLVP